jgi:AraC family transcriptional regulator of adaptative response/methylated-DNA-[protein]-cysteine methyltransferase
MATRCVVRRFNSPVGPLTAGASDAGICLLEFAIPARLDLQLEALRRTLRCDVIEGDHPHVAALEQELRSYFAGALNAFTVPVTAVGTPFQERVWAELLRIPYGQTRSYEDIAAAVGSAGAQRAVGRANGSNRIAIVIPCHRVVNKNGALGGYGGLLWRKDALLGLERKGQLALPQQSLFADPAMAYASPVQGLPNR